MATALQCPDCGFKHRLSAVGDRDVFACSRCGRSLKVPAGYRPGTPPSTNGDTRGASAPASTKAGAARRPSRAAPGRAPAKGGGGMRLPIRILLWMVAFVLGAVVVRTLAKWTGFAGGDTFFDLLIDGSIGTYLRLFALVPVWALFATLFATALIDGPRAWARRRSGAPAAAAAATRGAARTTKIPPAGARPPRTRTAAGTATAAAAGAAAGAGAARAGQRSIPRRERPAATPSAPGPSAPAAPVVPPEPTVTVPPAAARTAAVPVVASEPADDPGGEYAARAAAGQRPRRIPRRGDGS